MANIVSYSARWNLNDQSGRIAVKLSAPTLNHPNATVTRTLQPLTAEEMHLLVDLLRNERPVEYDSTSKELWLGEWEVTGEEES
ncbi:MAG TPA: hypothetical protein VFV34_18470 [Blastocatellia bacterium]|nr:hypothetical protein [Blastocatellia bacterium]